MEEGCKEGSTGEDSDGIYFVPLSGESNAQRFADHATASRSGAAVVTFCEPSPQTRRMRKRRAEESRETRAEQQTTNTSRRRRARESMDPAARGAARDAELLWKRRARSMCEPSTRRPLPQSSVAEESPGADSQAQGSRLAARSEALVSCGVSGAPAAGLRRRSGGGGRFCGELSDEGHEAEATVEEDRPTLPRAEFSHAEEAFVGDARYAPALHTAGEVDVACPFCRVLHFRGERTSRSTNVVPKFAMCCHNGAVALPAFPDPPEPLNTYLEADTPQRRRVVNHLRLLNNALSLAAMISHPPPALPGETNFDPQVRLHGRLTHVVGPLLPGAGQAASFLQAFFLDSEENGWRLAAVCRAAIHGGRAGAASGGFGRVNASTLTPVERGLFDALRALYAMLREHNALVRQFLTAHERVRAIETAAGHPIQELRIIIEAEARPNGAHVRVLNAPTPPENGEAAALLPVAELEVTPEHSEECRPPACRDVALALRGSPRAATCASTDAARRILQEIPADNPLYYPAAYTLLFPLGTAGWHTQISRQRRGRQKCVSAAEYLSYYLFTRAGQANYIHRCGRLFGAWAVDGYVKVEHFNLKWLRFNQTKLRCANYSRLIDAVHDGQQAGERIGRGILLNDGFVGSPRYMHTKYAQCMTICKELGRPTFFITFTCNPKWKEIVDALLPGQDARDRPDLLSLVFELNYKRLLALITKLDVFGRYAGHVSVIEFQKRGLPHVHLILWLHKCDRPLSPQDYDK